MERFAEQNPEEALYNLLDLGWDGRAVIIEATPTKVSQNDNYE